MKPNAEKVLKADFESYLQGKEPDGGVVATAPVLLDWSIGITKAPSGGHEMYLTGEVLRHPAYPDGKQITTSAVVWLDPQHRWARTRTRVYVLNGKIDGGAT